MIKKTLLYIFFLMSGIYGCTIFHSSEGTIKLTVSFPQKNFTLKVIPKDTKTIKVEVSGQGLTSAINFSLSATEPNKTIRVPVGMKQVKATATDDTGKILATGAESVNVTADSVNMVRLKLQV